MIQFDKRLICRQLNDNQLVGGIPAELGKLEQLFELSVIFLRPLFHLYLKFTSIFSLLLSYGFGMIFLRNLANNDLEGPIPLNISSCTALNQLYDS